MSKVIEVTSCSECPFKSDLGDFCNHSSFYNDTPPFREIKDIFNIPEFCPLEDSEDFAESNFNIDKEP